MANTSILAAFERMWQHVVALVGNKASLNTHNGGWIGTGTYGGQSSKMEAGIVSICGTDGEGVNIVAGEWDDGYVDGKAVLSFCGTAGDEASILRCIANPVQNSDAANKAYVDSKGIQMARGSWDGSGSSRTITCGFKPDVVFITIASIGATGDYTQGTEVWETSKPWMDTWEEEEYEILYATNTGFVVNDPNSAMHLFTQVDYTYYYLAVKFG